MQIWFVYKRSLFRQQILSVESFIQISVSLVSKATRVKLSHRGNCPLKQIWLAHGKFLAQLLHQLWPSFLNISQKLLITQSIVNEMYVTK